MTIRHITVAQYRNEHKHIKGWLYFGNVRIVKIFPIRKEDGTTLRVRLYDGNTQTECILQANDLLTVSR